MIEFIAEDICSGCGKCVEVCPADVFDLSPLSKTPQIARQDDCSSCRQCTLHCPTSAIYVTLLEKPIANLDRQKVIAEGKLGAYAHWLGWREGKPPGGDYNAYGDQLRELRKEPAPDPSDRVRRQLYEAKDRNYI